MQAIQYCVVIYIIKDGRNVDTRILAEKPLGKLRFGRPRRNWRITLRRILGK
jgi:hypothetical protein